MNPVILVVGGLAAGPSAASKAKRTNPDAEVILFERGEFVSYGVCEIPYYVGGTVTDLEDLNPLEPARLESTRGIKVKIGHNVEQILPTKKRLVVRDLEHDRLSEFRYDRLILATGSLPRSGGIPGQQARNVFRVKSLTNGIAIKKFVDEKKPKKCVIVGGGYVGMEMCEALVERSVAVTLLLLESFPMSTLEDETRQKVLDTLTKNGVLVRPKQSVKEFVLDQNGDAHSVITESGKYECDMAILATGVVPNTELASQARIRLGPHKGIVADERQSTSIDSIYAAGDCCEVKNLVTGRWSYIPLATYASRQGRVAGENAAGGTAVFKGGIRSIAVRIFDVEVARVGISFHEAIEGRFDPVKVHVSSDTKVSFFPGNEKTDIVAIVDRKTGRLLGANVYGGKGSVLRANGLAMAIQQKMTVTELAQTDFIYSPPFSPLWDPLLVLANQVRHALKI